MVRQIKKNIYWVGGIDWNLREFHGYSTPFGTTYNAYLILDEKVTLVDTVKHYLTAELIKNIKEIIDPAKIDYIISNHTEMDHSGAILDVLKFCPKAEIIASVNGEKGLKKHFGDNLNIKAVKMHDKLNIGKLTLDFVLIQMVHWPDSMATYIRSEKLLMPNDAFGQHYASSERFVSEFGYDFIYPDAKKYFANILLPYAGSVQKALQEIKPLTIDMIAPSHGLIWDEDIEKIMKDYEKWSNNETLEKAVVVFDTMWESTEKIAHAIYDVFAKNNIKVSFKHLKHTHISDVMIDLLDARYICVGSPTLNNTVMPSVAAFLAYMSGLSPKNRIGLAFGSYGWGGQSVGIIEESLKKVSNKLLPDIKIQYVPTEGDLKGIAKALQEIKK